MLLSAVPCGSLGNVTFFVLERGTVFVLVSDLASVTNMTAEGVRKAYEKRGGAGLQPVPVKDIFSGVPAHTEAKAQLDLLRLHHATFAVPLVYSLLVLKIDHLQVLLDLNAYAFAAMALRAFAAAVPAVPVAPSAQGVRGRVTNSVTPDGVGRSVRRAVPPQGEVSFPSASIVGPVNQAIVGPVTQHELVELDFGELQFMSDDEDEAFTRPSTSFSPLEIEARRGSLRPLAASPESAPAPASPAPSADVVLDCFDLFAEERIDAATEKSVSREVLLAAGVCPDPIPVHSRISVTVVGTRDVDNMRRCVEGLGHLFDYVRMNVWEITIDARGKSSAMCNALRDCSVAKIVLVERRGQQEKQKWIMSSVHVDGDVLTALCRACAVDPVPRPPVHIHFSNSAATLFLAEHPWLNSHPGCGSDSPVANVLQSGSPRLVSEPQLARIISEAQAVCHDCRRHKNAIFSAWRGMESKVTFQCECNPKSVSVPLLGSSSSRKGDVNRIAFLVKEMSGRPVAVDNFLEGMGIGGRIEGRSSAGSYSEALWKATHVVYMQCVKVVTAYMILSKPSSVSLDAFHKRMAKAYSTLGEAFSTGFSVCDARMRKVLYVVFTERKVLDEATVDGVCSMASPVPGMADSTTTKSGIEHRALGLSLQQLNDIFFMVKAYLASNYPTITEKMDVCLEQWYLENIATDALSSAGNSIKEFFPNARHFIDWWHRRTSIAKLLTKLELRYPVFGGLGEAVAQFLSDAMYNGSSWEEEVAPQIQEALLTLKDQTEKSSKELAAWSKCFAKMQKMYLEVNVQMGSAINEMFHAHVRRFAIKGDKMSPTRWKTMVAFAFLDFNQFPNWKLRVRDEFLKLFGMPLSYRLHKMGSSNQSLKRCWSGYTSVTANCPWSSNTMLFTRRTRRRSSIWTESEHELNNLNGTQWSPLRSRPHVMLL